MITYFKVEALEAQCFQKGNQRFEKTTSTFITSTKKLKVIIDKDINCKP
jgi:hypothetical protein